MIPLLVPSQPRNLFGILESCQSSFQVPDDPLCIQAQEYGIEDDDIYQSSSDESPTQGVIPQDRDSSTPITSQILSAVRKNSLTSPVTVCSPMLKRKAIPRPMSKTSKKKKKKDSPQDNTKRQHVLSFLQSVADDLENKIYYTLQGP